MFKGNVAAISIFGFCDIISTIFMNFMSRTESLSQWMAPIFNVRASVCKKTLQIKSKIQDCCLVLQLQP